MFYVIDLWKVAAEIDWGPWLDLAAYVLPFILALVGVWVSVETPMLETPKQRAHWRAGLLVFGLVTSVIAYEQQRVARSAADRSTKEQVELAKQEQATRYIPVGFLTFENHRLVFYNKGKTTLYFWGNKLDDGPKDLDTQPRLLPLESNYYIPTEELEKRSLSFVGQNGEKSFPYDMYFKNELGVKYVASFTLLFVVRDSNVEIRPQMRSFERRDW